MSSLRSDRSVLQKTLRVSAILEQQLGIPPRQRPRPDPLDMLVATILSQNTNDKNSHRAYTELRKRFPSWREVAEASRASIVSAIKTGGMANQKGARIKEILRVVHARYGAYALSRLRRKTDDVVLSELTSLNGVGVKTAACVLLFSLGRNIFPVDTHVHRLCTRLGLATDCHTPEQTFLAMRGLVPPGKAHAFHTNLIRFGRSVCKANHPRCGICPLYRECVFPGKLRRPGHQRRRTTANHDFMLLDNIRRKGLLAG